MRTSAPTAFRDRIRTKEQGRRQSKVADGHNNPPPPAADEEAGLSSPLFKTGERRSIVSCNANYLRKQAEVREATMTNTRFTVGRSIWGRCQNGFRQSGRI